MSKKEQKKTVFVEATEYFQYYSLATLILTGDMSNEDFRALKAGQPREVDVRIVKTYPILFREAQKAKTEEK